VSHRLSLRAAAILIALAPVLFSQTFTGTILGTIQDSSGAVIAGAKVSARETQTNVVRTASSNELGYYELPLLPPGTYTIESEHTGFKKYSRANLKLDIGQRMEVGIALTPGDVTETVEVTAESPLLQTTTSSVGQVLDNKKIVDLPTSNRNLFQLVNLVSGVYDFGAGAAPATSGSVAFGRYSSNGGMTNTNEFMLDGATAILANMNAASIIPTIDAIEEFKIHTNAMNAEYGRTGGAVISATYKSGTNQLHGTVYDFWKNAVLNANTWVSNKNKVARAYMNVHTFGYSVGGPVYIPKVYDGRNKTFFFTNYEGYRDVLPTRTLMTVPTALEVGGNFSERFNNKGALYVIYDPLSTTAVPGQTNKYTRQPFSGNIIPTNRIDPVSKNLIAYYPRPNVTPIDPYSNTSNYLTSSSGKNKQTEWAVKLDHNLSSSHRIFGRYSQSDQGGGASNYFGATPACPTCLVKNNPAGAFSARGGGSDLNIFPKNVVIGHTWTASPTLLVDLRYAINRQLLSRLPQSGGFDLAAMGWPSQLTSSVFYPVFPPISISNYQALGVMSNGDYLRRGDITHALQGSVTKLRGAHTLKAGGDARLMRYFDIQAYDITPSFSFNQTWTQQDPYTANALGGWGLASFLLGTPAGGNNRIPGSVAIQLFYFAGYVQDDWRVNNRLTLNIGFRYDLETPFTERFNRTSTFDLNVTNAATARWASAVGGLQFMGKEISSRYRNPVDRNNFGPRFGLAYKIKENLVLRAAYGIFYQPSLVNGYGQTVFGANGYDGDTAFVSSKDGGLTPSAYLSNPFAGGFNQPVGNAGGVNTLLGQGITTQLRDIVVPYSQQYNLGFQYQLKSWLLDVGYVGSHGLKQPMDVSMTQLPLEYYKLGTELNKQVANPFLGLVALGSYANPTISYGTLLRPFPQFSGVTNQYRTSGNMNFNSLQVKVERRFSKGFAVLTSYTWGKNISNVGERYWIGSGVANAYDLRSERGLANIDIPHRLTLTYLWDLPFGKGKPFGSGANGFVNLFIGGWQVNGFTTFQSGTPLSVTCQVNQVGGGAGCRPLNNGQSAKLSGSARTVDRWFDTTVFSQPAPFIFGNTSRYSPDLRGTGVNSWSTSFFKTTSIKERLSVQFRAEFFNLFNHPMWSSPGTGLNSATFGKVTSKGGNRTGQLGLKLIF
jgi:hypothetical protein